MGKWKWWWLHKVCKCLGTEWTSVAGVAGPCQKNQCTRRENAPFISDTAMLQASTSMRNCLCLYLLWVDSAFFLTNPVSISHPPYPSLPPSLTHIHTLLPSPTFPSRHFGETMIYFWCSPSPGSSGGSSCPFYFHLCWELFLFSLLLQENLLVIQTSSFKWIIRWLIMRENYWLHSSKRNDIRK